ncbi:MAG: tRNA (adenosine(37)-N6)-threonylcarbamoyltransferase complex ATPase subunit type 1 TsaE [Dokdonella sp.]
MKEAWNVAGVDEAQLVALAAQLAPGSRLEGGVIHLAGELGAGKTTFARALLLALGVGVRVKSPTYSLIESYDVLDLDIHHLDLYRIADAGELEWLGLPDLWRVRSLILIEWPERGGNLLPPPDLAIELAHRGVGRDLSVRAFGERGRKWLQDWLATSGHSTLAL